jgi:hypothetical protein
MSEGRYHRAARFGAYGAAVGASLFLVGVVGWWCGLALGVETDSSTSGMAAVAVQYPVVFGLGGAVLGGWWESRRRLLGAIVLGMAATGVVLGGCLAIAVQLVRRLHPEITHVPVSVLSMLALATVFFGALFGVTLRLAK